MQPTAFKLEREAGGLAVITLDRPDRLNALTFEVYRELRDFFRDEQRNEATRCVMITGAGRAFCSGGDVHDIIGALRGAKMKAVLDFAWLTGETVQVMRNFDRPIVAAINGTCVGAGAVLALAADFRVIADDAAMAFIFTKVGLTGSDMGVAYLLQRAVGMARATEILMLGDPVPAARALEIGLVNRVAPKSAVVAEARTLAQRLLDGPPLGLRMTKRMLNNEWNMDLASAIEAEAQAQALMMMGDDHSEYHRAFVEKRKPSFRGE